MKIVYDEVTKVFGIHTDRVNGLRLDPRIAKRKNYDEDKLADISEINQLRRSGIIPDTNTPDRVLKIKEYEDNKKTGWGRLKNRVNKFKDEMTNVIKDPLGNLTGSHFPDLKSRFRMDKADLMFKWDKLYNLLFQKRDRNVKDNLKKFAKDHYIEVNEDLPWSEVEHTYPGVINLRKSSSPAILAHELGHRMNEERGEHRVGNRNVEPTELINEAGRGRYNTPDILREEDNANRDAVMNAWVHGGADVKDLDRYFKTAKRAQATYNAWNLNDETPANVDYHMDPELREKIKEQINEKDYVNKPYKKTGHKDLTWEERYMHYPDDKWWWYK